MFLKQYDGNQITSWDKCDWRPKETEKQKDVKLKFSEAIRIGLQYATPDPRAIFLTDGKGRACLIGLGVVGHFRDFDKAASARYETCGAWGLVEEIFGINRENEEGLPLRLAEADFMFGRKSAEQCADWLESQGY